MSLIVPWHSENVTFFKTLFTLLISKSGGGSPRKKAPKSAGASKTHMPSVKTATDKKQEEVSYNS